MKRAIKQHEVFKERQTRNNFHHYVIASGISRVAIHKKRQMINCFCVWQIHMFRHSSLSLSLRGRSEVNNTTISFLPPSVIASKRSLRGNPFIANKVSNQTTRSVQSLKL
jgi:hypothetical protein